MQVPETPRSPEPREEVERLREQLRRLEGEQAEVQQTLFDHYEWTRQKTKGFQEELRSLRSISFEYQVLNFLRTIYQRSTGLPLRTLQEDVELVKVSLVLIPAKGDANVTQWIRPFLQQTHSNFELIVVLNAGEPDVPEEITDRANVRVVRVDDSYSDAIRADIGLCYANGDIWGFVVNGFWPYERTIENIARYFCARRDCRVLLPLDLPVADHLIAPTEEIGSKDFTVLWRTNFPRLGSLFFRPKAYKRLGRIVSDAGESWIFATMLYLATFFRIEQPSSLIFVNTSGEGLNASSNRESTDRDVRNRFYRRSPFRDFEEAVWYFPVTPSTRNTRLIRKMIEQGLLCTRALVLWPVLSFFYHLQKIFFPERAPLHFPAAVADGFDRPGNVVFDPLEKCPLTQCFPDRFLFSLLPTGGTRIADIFFSSETKLAIVHRGRPIPASSGGVEESGNQAGWRFRQPVLLRNETARSDGEPQPVEHETMVAAYERLLIEVLDKNNIGEALWIGSREFAPPDGRIPYVEQHFWEDYPALVSADLAALRDSNLIAGRTTETGFDLVHLSGVIQFCSRPRHLLRFLAFALKYHQFILVSTPNLDSRELRHFGPAWCHWQPARTAYVYGVDSLRALMGHCGYEEKKLLTFSHPAWQSATRKNVVNTIPASASQKPATWSGPDKAKGKWANNSNNLDGDFLVGLFARKL